MCSSWAAVGCEYEVYASAKGHRWRARSKNGQVVAVGGEPFSSQSSARRAANNVRDKAGSADGP